MRRFLHVWLLLWAAGSLAGIIISAGLFRHLDLSFSSLCSALLVPIVQAGALVVIQAVRFRPDSPRSDRPLVIDRWVLALLVADLIALQLTWLAIGTRHGEMAETVVLRHLLALHLAAIAALCLDRLVRLWIASRPVLIFILLPTTVAALELYLDPVNSLASKLDVPALALSVALLLASLLTFGLLQLTVRLERHDVLAGRLANGALGVLFASTVLAVLILHGGAQLGVFWQRVTLTGALVAAALLLAAWRQAHAEPRSPAGTITGWWWNRSPADRLVLLGACYLTFIAGRALVASLVGAVPGLAGESFARTVLLPAAQAGAVLVVLRARPG